MKPDSKILKILLVLLTCFLLWPAQAQNSVLVLDAELKKVQTDALTGLKIDPIGKDRSNRPCARIKLHVNRMSPEEIRSIQVKTIGGNAIVMKSVPAVEGNGLIVEMTALKPVRFYLHHPKYGDSNPVSVDLEGHIEYRMEAWCNFLQTITVSCPRSGAAVWLDDTYRGVISEVNNALSIPDVMTGKHHLKVTYGEDSAEQDIMVDEARVFFALTLQSAARLQQYVVFDLKPANALVTLDGDVLAPDDWGNAARLVRYGVHNYVVEAKDYHSKEGSFSLNASNAGEALRIDVELKPAFGYLKVSGPALQDARIYVDKEFKGLAPLDSIRLSSGLHRVNLVKPMYKDLEIPFNIQDGRWTTLSPDLIPDFSSVTLETLPEASIYINDKFMAKGKWAGDLSSGAYEVKVTLENHRPSVRTLTIVPGMSHNPIRLADPEPILGTLSIDSSPVGAELWIDGVLRGRTPTYLTNVLIGTREVKLVKEGFLDYHQQVKIKENQVTEVRVALNSTRMVRFSCVQRGAELYVDGDYMGPAEGSYALAYGQHDIQVRLKGYRTYMETIDVTPDAELSVNVFLTKSGSSELWQRPDESTAPQVKPDKPSHPSSGHEHKPAPAKKPGKAPLGWLFGDAVRRPLGFNIGLGFDYETDVNFKENSYGLRILGSLGNAKNAFNLEMGLRLQFWSALAVDTTEEDPGFSDDPFYDDPYYDHFTSSTSDRTPLQYRVFVTPRYNFIRKKSSHSYYCYGALELSCNFFGMQYKHMNGVNFSTVLRLGAGIRNYDFSIYWNYDVTPIYTNAISPASYHRSRAGLSFALYLF